MHSDDKWILSTESDIQKAKPDEYVTLARGCHSPEQVKNIKTNKTAGGDLPARNDGEAPSEKVAIEYVSFETMPNVDRQNIPNLKKFNVIEYTTDQNIAKNFGTRVGSEIVYIKIQKKYLIKGSGVEAGWISYKNAPVEVKE